MKNKKPILTSHPLSSKEIKPGRIPEQINKPILQRKEFSDNFTFSFQYFNQIQYFEIGGVNNSWYVSLIERLKSLCNTNFQDFEKSVSDKRNLRYHEIDWGSKNIPIKRSDLNWIDKAYLENEEDFPMFQFHVSKALGRVVGFWDAYHVFQIVLLDPKHNIQPSVYNSYKVDDTYFMSCEYSSLLIDLRNIQAKVNAGCSCEICIAVKNLPSKLNDTNLLIAHLDNSYFEKFKELDLTPEEVIEFGLLKLSEE